MKAIMMSIRPQYVAKILNKEKTIEVRKKFPADYVGWVYVYCTQKKPYLTRGVNGDTYPSCCISNGKQDWHLNGKVVARFWCDKVEEQPANRPIEEYVFVQGCLTSNDILEYCGYKTFYAIHITKLEIFDKPKEINEFSIKVFPHRKDNLMTRYLTRAPQSWQFIEI